MYMLQAPLEAQLNSLDQCWQVIVRTLQEVSQEQPFETDHMQMYSIQQAIQLGALKTP